MDDKKAEVRFVALATRVRKHTHTHTGLQAHGIQRNSTPARRLVSAFTSLFESKTSEVRTIPLLFCFHILSLSYWKQKKSAPPVKHERSKSKGLRQLSWLPLSAAYFPGVIQALKLTDKR